MSFLEYVIQQIVNAVSQGSLFALVAVGLSIIFSLLRLTNFAHGDMMMVGAFATLMMQLAGLPFLLAVVVGIAISAVVGIIIERVAYRPVRGAPDVTMLLTSVALTYILENLGILLFTSSPRNFPLPDWMGNLYSLSDGRITFTNINPVVEQINAMEASRAYEANIAAAEATKTMISQALRLLA